MTTHHTDEKKPADAGGRLEAQASKPTLCDDAATELDVQIAQLVFGVDSSATQVWPWGVPPFSTDRNWCAAVVGRMLAHQAASEFDTELERRALLWGWKNDGEKKNIPALILVLTPDEICNAALDAIQQFHCGE
ncbi:hypothetical protein ACLS0R_14990 [Comamonas jiangduensis]|uniref:hypothetical protein n=1 Tax=Comamonas jiangduensis TaxID=1194168 RepID=UPI003BF7BC4F